MIAFIFILSVFTEYNTASAEDVSVTLFKRGSKVPASREAEGNEDEEKGGGERTKGWEWSMDSRGGRTTGCRYAQRRELDEASSITVP